DKNDPTKIPYDKAGYMDIAPDDRGENIRREVCLTLEQMGIIPESSHHEEGPGQNEIDFRYADALAAADNVITFQNVVRIVARRNGLYADFSAKPLDGKPGNGFHINMSVSPDRASENLCRMIAGVLERVIPMSAFLCPTEASYRRLGVMKAPHYVSWSSENRSQLVRIPAALGEYRRAELRMADPCANPYLAFALAIWAGIEGLEKKLDLPSPANVNLFTADEATLSEYRSLPRDLAEAKKAALEDDFIKKYIPQKILDIYCKD
ncbi:MAG: type I glutamate--ammonia ligase, partial [Clostridia bacterium]|nr:type I glutamate--ammonia ligase [Clostridia bacterium]